MAKDKEDSVLATQLNMIDRINKSQCDSWKDYGLSSVSEKNDFLYALDSGTNFFRSMLFRCRYSFDVRSILCALFQLPRKCSTAN